MVYTKINDDEIKKWLKENLNEERYLHSLGTAECAVELADKFGLDKEKAPSPKRRERRMAVFKH